PSPAQNQNNGAAGGCEEEPDVAAVLPAVVVAVVLPLLPVTPSLPSERMYDLEVARCWLSHKCPPQ
ncbi:hypothetical protein A2U01_0079455, partial [Trifolium medium]|nr:hypothetical protein [Trifolium medium]